MPVMGPPNRHVAAVTVVDESDEEVFANFDLDLNEEEALVLYGAQCKTWPMNRDQKREQRKDRQITDRLATTDETTGSERMSKCFQLRDCTRSPSVPIADSVDIGIVSQAPRARSL